MHLLPSFESSHCVLALQRFHLLQNGKPGQPDSKRRPAADTGCGEILQQRGGPLLKPQQGTELCWP